MYVKKIYLTYVSKHISNREKQVIILMIPNVEGREAKSDLPGNKTYPTSLCTSQWRRKYASDETPTDVSVARPHNVLLELCDDVSRGGNNDVPSVRLHEVSNKPQIKH